jgi:hypothetical protein
MLVILAATALACGNKSADSGRPADTKPADMKPANAKTAVAEAKPVQSGMNLATWDPASKVKAWQGSWVADTPGSNEAWTIQGDKVTTWDGTDETKATLRVHVPCFAYFENEAMQRQVPFSVGADGRVRYRGHGAGYRKANEAIYCDTSGEVFTLDAAGKCVRWEQKEHTDEWTPNDGECGFKKDADGGEVFFYKGASSDEVSVEGDAILADASAELEPAPDHAAAKKLRDVRAKEDGDVGQYREEP